MIDIKNIFYDTTLGDHELAYFHSLLDDRFLRYRSASDGHTKHASLPEVLHALAADDVRDFPALRPHQRHPWYAFLVQLAAIALHQTGKTQQLETASEWRDALMELTPGNKDGAAWYLVTPPESPAFFQAPEPTGDISAWDDIIEPDALDILQTSKNHDLKAKRMRISELDDWVFSLVTLQTMAGSNSGSYKGISRMNSGAGSRPAVGVVPAGGIGRRWQRDVSVLIKSRHRVASKNGLCKEDGLSLLWLMPWGGESSLTFKGLDPYYIEICRRIRLDVRSDGEIYARSTTTPNSRIAESPFLKGITGDPWAPINLKKESVMSIQKTGFNYKVMCDLLRGGIYTPAITQIVQHEDGKNIHLLAQSIEPNGNSKTSGYHERKIQLPPKIITWMVEEKTEIIGELTQKRIEAIAELRKLVWSSLCLLFGNGDDKAKSKEQVKERANLFAQAIERNEDPRFFDDLRREVDAEDGDAEHLDWLLGLVERCEQILRNAFIFGPHSHMQRYRAQSAALKYFHSGLRDDKFKIQKLADYYRAQRAERQPVPEGASI